MVRRADGYLLISARCPRRRGCGSFLKWTSVRACGAIGRSCVFSKCIGKVRAYNVDTGGSRVTSTRSVACQKMGAPGSPSLQTGRRSLQPSRVQAAFSGRVRWRREGPRGRLGLDDLDSRFRAGCVCDCVCECACVCVWNRTNEGAPRVLRPDRPPMKQAAPNARSSPNSPPDQMACFSCPGRM